MGEESPRRGLLMPQRIPCFSQSLATGVAVGAALGLHRYRTDRAAAQKRGLLGPVHHRAINAAIGGFFLTSVIAWTICRAAFRQEQTNMDIAERLLEQQQRGDGPQEAMNSRVISTE